MCKEVNVLNATLNKLYLCVFGHLPNIYDGAFPSHTCLRGF